MTLKTRVASLLAAGCLFALGACTTEETLEPETILRVKLHDSLASYEKVTVQVLDRKDTTKILKVLWDQPMPAGSVIEGYSLKEVRSKTFIVKVLAYKALGQLALKTLIFYEPGLKTVLHEPVPKLRPLNYLESIAPSPGTMDKPFHRDTLRYTVTLPQDVTSLSFAVRGPASSGVSILVDGTAVASGTSSKIHQIGPKGDTLAITVTDTSADTVATRTYTFNVLPTLTPGIFLSSLEPSVGTLNSVFDPERRVYVVYMPQDVDTISFRAKPMDTRTMQLVIDGEAVFWPAPSKVITVPKGATYAVGIDVSRGGVGNYYMVTIDHTQTDH